MQVPFGPWRPDLAETNPAVTRTAINVNPRVDMEGVVSYHPRKALSVTETAAALAAAPRGALAVVSRAGVFTGFFGTAAELYELTSTFGFTAIGSGAYTLPTGHHWGMAQYGENIIFTNTSDGMFSYNIETPAGVNAITDAPDARAVFVAFECVFALDCDDDNRVMKNSAPGSLTNWTTQGAGYQLFADGEALMGGGKINDGMAGVLQTAAVRRLIVTGDKRIYRQETVAEGIGATSQQGIVQAPGALYFVDSNGPMRLSANGLDYIGQDKVSRTFMESVDDATNIEGAYDPGRRQVVWRYQASGVSSTIFENLLVFDLATSEFVEATEQTTALVKMSNPAQTLEDLDSFGDLDSLPFSLDSEAWKGGRPRLAALDEARKFGFFDGDNLAATVETATLTNTKTMLFRSATPITDATNVTIDLGVRDRLADAVSYKGAVSMKASGRVPLRGRGKAGVLKVEIPSGENWTYLRGVNEIDQSTGGPR